MSKFIGQKVKSCEVVAVSRIHRTPSGGYKYFYELRCSACSTVFVMAYENAKNAATPCPTCRKTETAKKSSEGYKHPLHSAWWGMLSRCVVPTHPAYKNYGGRGITVCDSWRGARAAGERVGSSDGFLSFCADMGDKPTPAHSIGRIDNDAGYSPENCAWQTQEEQMNNTRSNVWILVDGEQRTMAQWAKHLGVNAGRLSTAVKHLGPEKAIAFLRQVPSDCRFYGWDWGNSHPKPSKEEKRAEVVERQKRWRELLAEKFGW